MMKMIRYMLLILEKKHQKLSEKQKIGIKSIKMCADISHAPFISDKTHDIICIFIFTFLKQSGSSESLHTDGFSHHALVYRLFLVIEYVNGGDLMFHMQRQRKLPEEHAR